MVKKYRKKPVVVEAIQWTGDNTSEIMKWVGDRAYFRDTLYIKTLEGDHIASVGDYIIKGIEGEFYPCKPDIFKKTYEPKERTKAIKLTLKEQLLAVAETIEEPKALVVAVELPTGAIEIITNTSNIDTKLEYYTTMYDDEFRLLTNPNVRIVGAMIV